MGSFLHKYLFFLLVLVFTSVNAQVRPINHDHLEILSDVNAYLSNAWTINIKLNGPEEIGYQANAIRSFLFTYKTKREGGNSGVVLNGYDIKYKLDVENEELEEHSKVHVEYFYTKNYIFYLNHGKNVNEVYDSYMPILLEELDAFFQENFDKL